MTAKSGILVAADGRELWARQPDAQRPMASITKIMTAVVALEHSQPSDIVVVPKASAQVGESTSFLRVGEQLPMQEMIVSLLVKSGNDAAIAIADHVAGSEPAFVEMMNRKAQDLGLKNTHFANSHGLDQAGHYTTASDLAVLARYAMTKPEFRDIVSMKTAVVRDGSRVETMMNTNLLIGNYTGANGIKTGYTTGAGHSVIVSAQRDGIELYAVVLGTDSEMQRFKDARELLDWGFAHYRHQTLATNGTVVAEAPVTDYLDVVVPAKFSQDASASVLDFDGPITRTVTVTEVHAPVTQGQRVGVATFTQRGNVIESVPLVAVEKVRKPTIFERAWIGTVRVWRRLFGGQLQAEPVMSTAIPSTSAVS
jgi:D-alanyl-D-alanine carboxypeptidase (penicillin-binding protein 5/6)